MTTLENFSQVMKLNLLLKTLILFKNVEKIEMNV